MVELWVRENIMVSMDIRANDKDRVRVASGVS